MTYETHMYKRQQENKEYKKYIEKTGTKELKQAAKDYASDDSVGRYLGVLLWPDFEHELAALWQSAGIKLGSSHKHILRSRILPKEKKREKDYTYFPNRTMTGLN